MTPKTGTHVWANKKPNKFAEAADKVQIKEFFSRRLLTVLLRVEVIDRTQYVATINKYYHEGIRLIRLAKENTSD